MSEFREYTIDVNGQPTFVSEMGEGQPVLLLHGSGPGVSGMANWRHTLPALAAAGYRAIAPDQLGFGGTVPPADHEYTMRSWVDHAVGLLDTLGLGRVHLVGNSFGGALAMRLTADLPERVGRLVLMGAMGVPFELTEGLERVWGYRASVEEMAELMRIFAYDPGGLGAGLAQQRYEASIAGGADRRFAEMFPAPRQRWIDAMTISQVEIASIEAPTLIFHGREDRVIPKENSFALLQTIPNAELHVFGNCGHWTQIEQKQRFNEVLLGFLG